jgi:hypothetical protein
MLRVRSCDSWIVFFLAQGTIHDSRNNARWIQQIVDEKWKMIRDFR